MVTGIVAHSSYRSLSTFTQWAACSWHLLSDSSKARTLFHRSLSEPAAAHTFFWVIPQRPTPYFTVPLSDSSKPAPYFTVRLNEMQLVRTVTLLIVTPLGGYRSVWSHDFFPAKQHFSPKDSSVFTDSLDSCRTMRGGKRTNPIPYWTLPDPHPTHTPREGWFG